MDNFDLTYITIDSLSEGVGSSQIIPLVKRLSLYGLKINLISYEKSKQNSELKDYFNRIGVNWNARPFGTNGLFGGMERLNNLRREITSTNLIHARSDIPAVSGIFSHQAPVLWDVRSLWADQKVLIQNTALSKIFYRSYRTLESIASHQSVGMSTLTSAVVPILELRNRRLPKLRDVVPTAVDLDHFQLNLKMPSKFRALYSGTYNEYYDIPLSTRFIEALRSQVKIESHWARPKESKRSANDLGITQIFPASQREMAQIIPNYSFGMSVCRLDAGESLSAAMPTKIGEFLACGRPVVVNKGLGDMDDILNEFDAGVMLHSRSFGIQESATKLIDLVSDPETPERCRLAAEKYFSIEVGTSKYLALYKQMLNSKA